MTRTASRAVRLELHVSSGTYVRAIAQALGGHCTTLRRTAVGPFRIEEATDVEAAELMPASVALGRLPEDAVARVPRHGARRRARARSGLGRGSGMTVARAPAELERTPRAVAIGTFDGVHRGHRAVIDAADRAPAEGRPW